MERRQALRRGNRGAGPADARRTDAQANTHDRGANPAYGPGTPGLVPAARPGKYPDTNHSGDDFCHSEVRSPKRPEAMSSAFSSKGWDLKQMVSFVLPCVM